jgi:hypothetical protein
LAKGIAMMRTLVPAVLVSLVICLQLGRTPSAESGQSPAGPLLVIDGLLLTPWEPGESYQGGEQFDSRLEKLVQFWRAAAPLQDVFADLRLQTGVRLDFWPPQADEPRVPVTLYLNPQKPASLREVMAQLSWVTGCVFAYNDGVEGRGYYLLASSTERGAGEKLAAQEQAQREQFRTAWQERQEAERQAALAELEESRAALHLSEGEAIAHYRGSNDALLLNLLDPSRRAALTLLAGLPDDDVKQLFSGSGGFSREWSAWSPDQQAFIKQALGPNEDWPGDVTISISVGSRALGGALTASVPEQERRRPLGRATGLLSSGDLRGQDQIALLRLAGEVKTPEEETAARQQQREALQAERTARQEQWAQQREQEMAAGRSLTPARETLLVSLSLSGAESGSRLWKLQEAVAKATGLHVISDCFWPPRFRAPGRGGAAQAGSALDQLSAASASGFSGFAPPAGRGGAGSRGGPGGRGGMFGRGGDFAGGGTEGWGMQWGDAGTFLRFRSQSSAMWRAALLPADVLAQLDAWLEPAVSATSRESPERGESPLSGDIERMSWLAGRLDDLQVRLGGEIPYEDPSDQKAARRQELRRATLFQVASRLPLLRLLV